MTPAPSARARNLAVGPRRSAQVLLGSISTALLLAAVLAVAIPAVGLVTGLWRVVPVLSGSMRPAFDTGAAVLVVSAPSHAVRAGDVIIYHPPIEDSRPIVHRVVEVVEPGTRPVVRTQGDANKKPDPWVARLEGDSIWKVRTAVPHLGRALLLADNPGIRYGVLLMLILGLLVQGFRAIWRHPDHGPAGRRPWTLPLAAWEWSASPRVQKGHPANLAISSRVGTATARPPETPSRPKSRSS